MKKALLLILVLALALTPVLSACKPAQSKNSAQPEASATIPKGDEKNIYVWWNNSAEEMTVINTAIVDFLESHKEYSDGYNIEAYTPAAQDRNALNLNIQGKTAPQIVRMDHVYITALGATGNVENLADPKFGFDKEKDKFLKSTWDGVVYKDKVYGIPFDANTIAFLYNKDLLDKAGKSVPKTFDDIISTGKAIKALNLPNTYGYTLSFNDRDNWTTFNFLFWLWRLGGDVLNKDYTKATFNGPEGVEALNKYIQIVKTEQIAKPDGYGEGDFGAGNVGMIDMGQWYINGLAEHKNWKFAPMPTLKEGVPGHSGLGLYALSVVSEAAGNKATKFSYDFAKFLGTTPKYQIDFCKIPANNFTPSLLEAQKDPYFSDEVHKVFVDQLAIAKARPGVACWPDIEEAIHAAINEVLIDGRAPNEALNAAAKRVDDLLAGITTAKQ